MEEREADSCAIGMSEQNPDSYEQSGQSDNAKNPASDRDSDGDEHYKFQQEFATMTEKLHQSERLMKPLLGNLQSTLRLYRNARAGNSHNHVRGKQLIGSRELSIFLMDEVQVYPEPFQDYLRQVY